MVPMAVGRMMCIKARHASSPAQIRASLGVIPHLASWSFSILSFLSGELATHPDAIVWDAPVCCPLMQLNRAA